ncbi:Putative epimerase/dehydratase OS=Lysinibacillus sphaericus OX=1421 GN=LYSIN_02994 PE=3 SV=1 [Lysinibacillus sphaericus]
MEKIMVTGALGQIGSELVEKLRSIYGEDNVLATDIRKLEHTKGHSKCWT